jgi:hypothetical protein
MRISVFENMLLRKIFGPKKDEGGNEGDRKMTSWIICTPHQTLFG